MDTHRFSRGEFWVGLGTDRPCSQPQVEGNAEDLGPVLGASFGGQRGVRFGSGGSTLGRTKRSGSCPWDPKRQRTWSSFLGILEALLSPRLIPPPRFLQSLCPSPRGPVWEATGIPKWDGTRRSGLQGDTTKRRWVGSRQGCAKCCWERKTWQMNLKKTKAGDRSWGTALGSEWTTSPGESGLRNGRDVGRVTWALGDGA